MKKTLTIWLVIAFLAGAASADDAEDRLREAVAKVADADPETRAKGREMLDGLAADRPDLVRKAAANPDAEVAATARRALFDLCILKDLVEQKRFGEILASIADPERTVEARRELFRKYLDLGPEAAQVLADEMKESCAKSATPAFVLEPGQRKEVELKMRNAGTRGLWYSAERYASGVVEAEWFGGNRIGCGSGGHFSKWTIGRNPEPEKVLNVLATLRRVPPGSDVVLATVSLDPDFCSLYRAHVENRGAESWHADFHGVKIDSVPASPENLPSLVIPVLAPRESAHFKATIVSKGAGGRPALCVKGVQDFDPPCAWTGNRFWWVATDGGGGFIACGPLGDPKDLVKTWKESEERIFEMPCEPPAGTRKLWLGFDVDQSGEQAVPPPLEISGPGAERR